MFTYYVIIGEGGDGVRVKSYTLLIKIDDVQNLKMRTGGRELLKSLPKFDYKICEKFLGILSNDFEI